MADQFFTGLDPEAAPDPVSPHGGPSDPAGWASVTPHGATPAPYDINAPQDIGGIAAAVAGAGALTGAGIVYPRGPRQDEALAILESPQGAGAMNVLTGFPDYESSDISPGANLETPVTGAGLHPGTTQDGIPQFAGGLGAGVEGVPPDGGSIGAPAPGYPGTTQDGLTKYGTS